MSKVYPTMCVHSVDMLHDLLLTQHRGGLHRESVLTMCNIRSCLLTVNYKIAVKSNLSLLRRLLRKDLKRRKSGKNNLVCHYYVVHKCEMMAANS